VRRGNPEIYNGASRLLFHPTFWVATAFGLAMTTYELLPPAQLNVTVFHAIHNLRIGVSETRRSSTPKPSFLISSSSAR
jgi:hypothetical protein